MPDEPRPGALDRAVGFLAELMNSVGLNGTRLKWKWNLKRKELAESGMNAEMLFRSARGKHKMCRSCRSLVPRKSRTCPECGVSLADVKAPGMGRVVSNAVPGMRTTTSLLLLVNGFWFALMLMAQIKIGEGATPSLFASFDVSILARFGCGYGPAVFQGGEWWRLLTPIFLHGSLIHFFFNSYVLLQVGPVVQSEFGNERYWVMYLLCGFFGNVASQLWGPHLTVGASGAIFGLMSLLIVHGWRIGGSRGQQIKSSILRYVFYIVIFSVIMGGGIDHMAHAGGFVMGAALGAVVAAPGPTQRTGVFWQGAALAAVILVLLAFWNVARSM